jgi:hypothetical protein
MSKKDKNGSCIECNEKIHETSVRCYKCASIESKRRYIDLDKFSKLTDLIEIDSLFVSLKDVCAYEKVDSRIAILSTKRKFLFQCIVCSKRYETLIAREKKKHYKWHCQSCATSLMWKSPDYHEKHVAAIVTAKSTQESIERHSRATKKKWENQEYREKTLSNLRKIWNSCEYRSNLSDSLKRRWSNNPPNCSSRKYKIQTTNGCVTVKSSYERDFVRFLENSGYSWEYEQRRFVLNSLEERVLIPDFYVKELDLVVEIKGYFWGDAKEKWHAFTEEYPDVKKVILFKDDLRLLTLGEKTLEDYFEKICGQETCL